MAIVGTFHVAKGEVVVLSYNPDPNRENPVLGILASMLAEHIFGGEYVDGRGPKSKRTIELAVRSAVQEALVNIYGSKMADWQDALGVSPPTAYKLQKEMKDRRLSSMKIMAIVAGSLSGRSGSLEDLSQKAIDAVKRKLWAESSTPLDVETVQQLEEHVRQQVKALLAGVRAVDEHFDVPQEIDLQKQFEGLEERCRFYANIFVRALRAKMDEGNRAAIYRWEHRFPSKDDIGTFSDLMYDMEGLVGSAVEQGDPAAVHAAMDMLRKAVESNREKGRGIKKGLVYVVDSMGAIAYREKEVHDD
ncbi:MAG: hypothetical protein R3B81_14210 [bacterium]